MAQDERFPTGSPPFTEGPASEPGPDELDDTSARLDDSPWDSFDKGYAHARTPPAREEPGMIHAFLENQLKERPLPTLLAAVAAGWLFGKLLR